MSTRSFSSSTTSTRFFPRRGSAVREASDSIRGDSGIRLITGLRKDGTRAGAYPGANVGGRLGSATPVAPTTPKRVAAPLTVLGDVRNDFMPYNDSQPAPASQAANASLAR